MSVRVERLALSLLADVPPALPIDIEAIIYGQGIALDRHDFEDDRINGFYCLVYGQPCITVNARHSIKRQRFTMAHELYHHIHDVVLGKRFAASIEGNNERQANRFAAALLMPRITAAALYKVGMTPDDMVETFQVSRQVVDIRLADIVGVGREIAS